jgi:hypothetical protein
MNDLPTDSTVALRRSVYVLLIVLGIGGMLGRILAVDSIDTLQLQERRIQKELDTRRQKLEDSGLKDNELQAAVDREEQHLREKLTLQRPFLSANDRSRWCTVRALVEPELRVPGAPYAIDKVIEQPRWDTIDMVRRKDNGHFYSSKPPLFATLVAGVYWPIYHLTGATLETEPYAIGRTILVLVNLLPLAVYFVLLARLAERFGRTDWGRIFVMAAGTLGTFLTTFAVVLNNHLPGAVCAMATLYLVVRIACDGERRLRYFFLAGLFAALLVTDELPALALLAVTAAALVWKTPRPALLGFLPGVLLVAAAFFATNYVAVGDFKPAYAHRSPGDNWYDYSYQSHGRTVESYWRDPQGIDRGEPSKLVYTFHALLGHHGIFSLTPVWLLSLAGMLMWLRRCDFPQLRPIVLAIALVSAICLVFYLGLQPQINRNYGGMSSGLRWMFWFTPLWLLPMLPAADFLAQRRWTRGLALVLLAISVASVSYPTWNPWTHPWLLNFLDYVGWL